jgi:hypothetical protein
MSVHFICPAFSCLGCALVQQLRPWAQSEFPDCWRHFVAATRLVLVPSFNMGLGLRQLRVRRPLVDWHPFLLASNTGK